MVLYINATEYERGNFRVIAGGLALYMVHWFVEIINALIQHFSGNPKAVYMQPLRDKCSCFHPVWPDSWLDLRVTMKALVFFSSDVSITI